MNEPGPIVYVVDDDPAVLKAVSRLLRSAGLQVAPFDSPQRFLDRVDPAAHACVLLDMGMPGLNGLELQKSLAASGAELPIIFLTGRSDIPRSLRAMKQGAVDFLTKPADEEELIEAVRSALSNDRLAREARMEVAEIRRRLAKLTPREYEVFEHVITGKLNKQTAAELGTVEKTIKVHRARVMEKMQIQTVAELVLMAERAGITSSTPLT